MPGFYYSNSAGCDKLIVFDVLVNEKPDNMYYALVQLNYQAMFALSFRLSRVWSLLGKIWLAVRTTLIFGMFRRWLSPIGPADHAHGFFGHAGLLPWQEADVDRAGGKRVTTYRCYPYFHALKNLPPGSDAAQQILEKVGFDSSVKKQPICYVFGAQKNTHFHLESNLKKSFARRLAARSMGSRARGIGATSTRLKSALRLSAISSWLSNSACVGHIRSSAQMRRGGGGVVRAAWVTGSVGRGVVCTKGSMHTLCTAPYSCDCVIHTAPSLLLLLCVKTELTRGHHTHLHTVGILTEDPTQDKRCRSRLHTLHLSAHYLLPEHHELTALLLTLLLRQLIDQLIDLLLRELHHLLLEGLLFTLRALHVLSR